MSSGARVVEGADVAALTMREPWRVTALPPFSCLALLLSANRPCIARLVQLHPPVYGATWPSRCRLPQAQAFGTELRGYLISGLMGL